MELQDLIRRLTGEFPYRILVIDDDPMHRMVVDEILAPPKYALTVVPGALEALTLLRQAEFDVVVTDRRMPGMSGDELCRRIRRELALPMLPILMVTGSGSALDIREGFDAGTDDFLRKPYLPIELCARVDAGVQRKRLTDQLDSTESTLFALARMVEAKDANTGDHCSRLAHNAVALGRALGLSTAELMALRRGGVLHDIGKLGIPDAILLKPGPLSPEEWDVMRQHTSIGHQLVSRLKSMRLTAPIIRHHHERWDGSGYPDGLAGGQIPLLARVFQLVDIYDALAFERPYKPALPAEQACAILEQEAARGWRDPAICKVFVELMRKNPMALSAPVPRVDDLACALDENLFPGVAAQAMVPI